MGTTILARRYVIWRNFNHKFDDRKTVLSVWCCMMELTFEFLYWNQAQTWGGKSNRILSTVFNIAKKMTGELQVALMKKLIYSSTLKQVSLQRIPWKLHIVYFFFVLCYLYHLVYLWTVAVEVKQPWAMWLQLTITLQWRHYERDSVSSCQPHDCLPNCLFKRRSKKTSKPRVNGLCGGNSPFPGEFLAQMASNAENVSIWWRHHDST